jgi:rare lipoprotein A
VRREANGAKRAVALCAVASIVASCASTPRPPAVEREAKAPPSAPAPTPPPRRGGGYYQDDGPGDGPTPDLERVPDAQPRAEPLNRFANNPYVVFGKEYVPERSVRPFRQRGLASWYGRKFHGQRTSSGETYDMYAMTAAHPTLPIPSYARVTSAATGRSVVVRVNDRGPFWPGRVIDLSYAAAWKLGYVEQGSTIVEVDAIIPGPDTQVAVASAVPSPQIAPVSPPAPAEAAPPMEVPVTTEAGGLYVQLAAFSARENAETFRARAALELASLDRPIEIYRKDGLFRLHVGPYRSRAEASAAAERLKDTLDVKPHVVVR